MQAFLFSSCEMSRDKSLSTSASASSYQSEIFFLVNYSENQEFTFRIKSSHLMSIVSDVLNVLGLAPSSFSLP